MEVKSTDLRPFPADIESEILLRLPVKTLVRFKCACKSWGMNTHCKVFTLGTSHWREVGSLSFRVCRGTASFLHGAVHCLPVTKPSGVQDTDAIAVFDIETEEYKKPIPLPAFYYSLRVCLDRGIVSMGDFMCLMKLGGSLGLIFDFVKLRCILGVWLLKDYSNGEWVKRYTINVSSVYPYASLYFWACPTDSMGDEEEDDILLTCTDGPGDTDKVKLLGYNPRDGNVTVMKDKVWASTFYVEAFYPL